MSFRLTLEVEFTIIITLLPQKFQLELVSKLLFVLALMSILEPQFHLFATALRVFMTRDVFIAKLDVKLMFQ